MKILFFHNTLPEYRIGWFCSLAESAEVDFVFTNEKQNEKDYGYVIDYKRAENINCIFLSDKIRGFYELKNIMKNIEAYNFVELPPIDSIREVIYSVYISYICKKKKIKLGYFWEKWEAPKNKQNFERKIKNYILRVIPRMIYRKADVIFSVGKKNKEYFISNGISEEKIKWIPDVSETPKCEYVDIRKQYNIPKDKKVVLYLGRMLKQKGVRNLIQAFSIIEHEFNARLHLIVAGEGEDLQNCRHLAKKLGVSNVDFVGGVNPSLRENYFAQCDIFVYPVTYYRGWVDVWGLTLNEAIQHGKIIISTDAVGSSYELIEDGVNGYRIEPENNEELVDALIKSIESSIKFTALKKDHELRQKYNYKCMALRYLNIVERCIDD